jgi:hypothetical protein
VISEVWSDKKEVSPDETIDVILVCDAASFTPAELAGHRRAYCFEFLVMPLNPTQTQRGKSDSNSHAINIKHLLCNGIWAEIQSEVTCGLQARGKHSNGLDSTASISEESVWHHIII